MTTDLYVARTSGIVFAGGKRHRLRQGRTVVRRGHPIMRGREHLFEPLRVHFDVEQATAAPGEKRTVTRRKKSKAAEPPGDAEDTAAGPADEPEAEADAPAGETGGSD